MSIFTIYMYNKDYTLSWCWELDFAFVLLFPVYSCVITEEHLLQSIYTYVSFLIHEIVYIVDPCPHSTLSH